MKNIIISSLLFVATTIFSSCEEIVDPPVPPVEDASIAITSISPEATYVKTMLDIQADVSFDTLSNYSVSIGGEPAEVLSTNSNTLSVKVPIELEHGDHAVTISYSGEDFSSPIQLSVLDHRELTVDGLAMALSSSEDYPIVAVNEEGEMLMPEIDPESNTVTGSIYINDNIQTYISTDENMLPDIMTTNGYVMLFDNYTETTFDVAVINPEGELMIHRELEASFENGQNARRASARSISLLTAAASVQQIAGCVLGEPMLAAGIPSAAVNGIAHCRSPLVLTANGALYNAPDNSIETSAPAFGIFTDELGCTNTLSPPFGETVIDCANILVAEGIDLELVSRLLQDEQADNIELARQTMQYGGGDVQITLSWDNTADIDLHVIEPNGERIYYNYPSSSTGGMLDVDDRDGFGPENIFWPTQQSPQGLYQVEVVHFSGESPTNYTVLVQALGQTRQYSGTITSGQSIGIVEFTLGETLPEGRFETSNINARLLSPKK
ncbi:hypothetical protein OKW21_000234 [Catalinimonas alkaloidigena]|uniref:IPT/TIG domain-containing protein n=1 Tax=Catalinimonas alkaloidigena TaxID=1075417 RepID=UPI0024054E2E|nr:IPT/TIG domain-containing protein [Catalinimonas alkaloidigena]MDF9794971.1 hypothetical protein [Catalinimonas alkaloidigena]